MASTTGVSLISILKPNSGFNRREPTQKKKVSFCPFRENTFFDPDSCNGKRIGNSFSFTFLDEKNFYEMMDFLESSYPSYDNPKERIQIFKLLFDNLILFEKSDDQSKKLARLNSLRRTCFNCLPIDVKEDIKYIIWQEMGAPDTLGSDFGGEQFLDNPERLVVKNAVMLACERVRYISKSSLESLNIQIKKSAMCALKYLEINFVIAELLAFQAIQLASFSPSAPSKLVLKIFRECLSSQTHSQIKDFLHNESGIDESNLTSNKVMRAVRSAQYNLLKTVYC